MADSKAPPAAFWVMMVVLFGGCCGVTALLPLGATRFTEWVQRESFMRGVRRSIDLPDEDEERIAALAYEAMMSTGGMRTWDTESPGHGAADGARRASDRTMLELHEVRTTLARASLPLCSTMWSGEGTPSAIDTALQPGAAVDETAACAAMLEVYDFIHAQPEPQRTRYARALFCSVSPVE